MTAETPLDLDAIEKRRAAITPGSWEHSVRGTVWVSEPVDLHRFDILDTHIATTHESNADAEFIAHAPEDIDALVAEVRRLREERDEFERRLTAVRVDLAHVDEATDGYLVAAGVLARVEGADDDGVDRAIRDADGDR